MGTHGPCCSLRLGRGGLLSFGLCAKRTETGWPGRCTCVHTKRATQDHRLPGKNVGSRGCSGSSPQSRWLCRSGEWGSRRCPSARPPGSCALCERNVCPCPLRLGQASRAPSNGTAAARLVSNADGTARLFYPFYSRVHCSSTAANTSEPESCPGQLVPDGAL